MKKFKRIRNAIVYKTKNKIDLQGVNNCINKNSTSCITNTHITMQGNNNTVIFGDDCNISGLRVLILGDGNIIEFGKRVTVNASAIQPTVINAVGKKNIKIGDGSLFSNNIEIHTTDYHGIYNSQGKRINPDKNILIGRYVWIGLGVKILKGTEIADGCVVGAGSVLSALYQKENAVIVGNPAKIVKEQIFWKSSRKETFEVPDILKEKWNLR